MAVLIFLHLSKKRAVTIVAVTALVVGLFLSKRLGYFTAHDVPPIPKELRLGPADYCTVLPVFLKKYPLKKNVAIDLSQTLCKGICFREAIAGGKILKHPQWDDFGAFGPYALDEKGNIYLAPIPFVSVDEHDPREQNKIYRMDSDSGRIVPFMTLPDDVPYNPQNPYNILGLAYDCDTRSLYVATVRGSSFDKELGRIYQIYVPKKKIVDVVHGLDAMGLAVWNDPDAKYLYYGSARTPEVYRIRLGRRGELSTHKPEKVLALSQYSGGRDDRCHRIRFLRDNTMLLKGVEFDYTLRSQSDVRRNIYRFRYQPQTKSWKFVGVERQKPLATSSPSESPE